MTLNRLAYFAALLTTILSLALAGNAAAACRTHTVTYPDQVVYCQTCCIGGMCDTTCDAPVTTAPRRSTDRPPYLGLSPEAGYYLGRAIRCAQTPKPSGC